MNIPSQYAWIASLLGVLASFLSVDSFCEFYFPVAVFLSIYFVFLVTHVLGKMAASAPRRVFAHKRTVRLIIDDDMRMDSLE